MTVKRGEFDGFTVGARPYLLRGECMVCGSQPGEQCIPECDEGALDDYAVSLIAVHRYITAQLEPQP